MRIAFFGTPAAAIPSLAALVKIANVELVVTQPDRRGGRGRHPGESPVKVAAREWGIPLKQPESDDDVLEVMNGREFDLAIVVAYGRILTAEILGTTRVGFVNTHFSLLPRWRGAAPVEHAILAGDECTGVTLMLIDEGLDSGPIISAQETSINASETGGLLTARLADLGGFLLRKTLPDFLMGDRMPAAQITAGVVWAPRLTSDDARLDPAKDAVMLERAVRAFHPRPGAWLSIAGVRTKVHAVRAVEHSVTIGQIEVIKGHPIVGCGSGALELLELQPSGRGVLTGIEWANGRRGSSVGIDPP